MHLSMMFQIMPILMIIMNGVKRHRSVVFLNLKMFLTFFEAYKTKWILTSLKVGRYKPALFSLRATNGPFNGSNDHVNHRKLWKIALGAKWLEQSTDLSNTFFTFFLNARFIHIFLLDCQKD